MLPSRGRKERQKSIWTPLRSCLRARTLCTSNVTEIKQIIHIHLCTQTRGNDHGSHLFLALYHVHFHVLCRVYAAPLLSPGFLSISCLRYSRNWRLLLPWVVPEHSRGTVPCLRKTESKWLSWVVRARSWNSISFTPAISNVFPPLICWK